MVLIAVPSLFPSTLLVVSIVGELRIATTSLSPSCHDPWHYRDIPEVHAWPKEDYKPWVSPGRRPQELSIECVPRLGPVISCSLAKVAPHTLLRKHFHPKCPLRRRDHKQAALHTLLEYSPLVHRRRVHRAQGHKPLVDRGRVPVALVWDKGRIVAPGQG